ncbi:MAG: hypothetical protein AAFR66_22280 [Bacteroidota bacterium]
MSLPRISLNLFLLLILSLTTIQPLRAQEDIIKQEFSDYYELIRNQEIDKAMDYIPEEFFDLFPRETMIAAMKQVFNTPGLEFQFGPLTITEVSTPSLMEGKWYAMLNHIGEMDMKVDSPEDSTATEADKQMYQEIMMNAFEEQFGEGNVSYNAETQFYHINALKRAVAISPNGQTDWKFIVAEKKQLPYLRRILPEKLMDELDK